MIRPTKKRKFGIDDEALEMAFTSPTGRARRVTKAAIAAKKMFKPKPPLQARLFHPLEASEQDWTASQAEGAFQDLGCIDLVTREEMDKEFCEYSESVLADVVSFNQVCPDLFVVQGWDTRSRAGTVRYPNPDLLEANQRP